jgi:hypothetical protein
MSLKLADKGSVSSLLINIAVASVAGIGNSRMGQGHTTGNVLLMSE